MCKPSRVSDKFEEESSWEFINFQKWDNDGQWEGEVQIGSIFYQPQ